MPVDSRVGHRGVALLLLLVLLMAIAQPMHAQEMQPDPVVTLMSAMSPEAKVGQLVLVSFPGTDVNATSPIAALIREYQIGGVLLRPSNGNFGGAGLTPAEVVSMTNQLQELAWESAQAEPGADESVLPVQAPYVPLFVAVEAEDHGVMPMAWISGTSPLPSPMAIGATWDSHLALASGTLVGREIAAVGLNLYLGPDLDVLYTPRPGDPADLGTRVFGGDPFWVGELGRAYIEGLHAGSDGRLLVVPRHLPGLGSADRPLEEEVPTVQKPLEQLKQIELAPFFAASRQPPGAPAGADGFLVTHIRYRGFQGNNIRRTTRPISLDASALQVVLALPEIADWRAGGGMLVADNLGMPSVQRFYDPRGLNFNARRVVQDALSAGNDLLILDRFGSPDNWDVHFANVRDTLKFLASRYKDEPAFQALVDDAVYRVLSSKLRLYPEPHIESIRRDPASVTSALGDGGNVSAQVALNAVTRIFPLTDDLLPPPPGEGDRIVIFAQETPQEVVSGVASPPSLKADEIEKTILRFYGPDATGVIRFDALQTFTFDQLLQFLQAPPESLITSTPSVGSEEEETVAPPISARIAQALQNADWVIFASQYLDSVDPASGALKEFLATEANVLSARLVVLAFGPPYELDSTEISKLSSYYGLYSVGPAFVEAGVRALFQDIPTPGDPPVDIPGLNYRLTEQTMPDPAQLLGLSVLDEAGQPVTDTARSSITLGAVIGLRTGVIYDRNGHPVPDGTPVQFILSYPKEDVQQKITAETVDGIAETTVTLDHVGQLNITVQSEPAVSSVRLEFLIRDDSVTITEVEPTLTPTIHPTSTPEPTATPTPTPQAPLVKIEYQPDPLHLPRPRREKLMAWASVGLFFTLALGFLWAREQAVPADIAVTTGLCGAIGGVIGYITIVTVSRWWLPAAYYGVAGREIVALFVTMACGGIVVAVAVWTLTNERIFPPREPPEKAYPPGGRLMQAMPRPPETNADSGQHDGGTK